MITVKLIGHASVVILAGGTRILCDPWFHGKAFNDSWSLLVPPAVHQKDLEEVDYLWVSHEHPDHFHVPTLAGLPEEFKKRVTVLFKTEFSTKMEEAFKRLGFANVRLLPHRKHLRLNDRVSVYCYHSGLADSLLAVISHEGIVINSNDVALTRRDCKVIRREVGHADVVLAQFGIAGSTGQPDHAAVLSRLAKSQMQSTLNFHQQLGADSSIPFASYVYFSTSDNRFINGFQATAREIHDKFKSASERCDVLYPGDTWTLGGPHNSEAALRRFDEIYAGLESLPYDDSPRVEMDELESAHAGMVETLQDFYPDWLLRRMPAIQALLSDLGQAVEFSLRRGSFRRLEYADSPTLILNSQPLHFAFKNPYGFQTLGISGRYRLGGNLEAWRYYRVLFSLRNAEVYMRPKYLLKAQMISYLWSRKSELGQQVADRWRTLFV